MIMFEFSFHAQLTLYSVEEKKNGDDIELMKMYGCQNLTK